MSHYKELLKQNKSPGELKLFLRKNLKNIYQNENNAKIAVMRLIDLQKEELDKHLETIDSDLKRKDLVLNYKDIEKHDISDIDVRNWFTKIEDDGFEIKEGTILINYEEIKDICKDYVSDDIRAYIDIESTESENPYKSENELKIEKKELAKRINEVKKYTDTYKNSPYISRVNVLRKEYLKAYMLGLPNSSVFEYYLSYSNEGRNRIKDEWIETYNMIVKEYESQPVGVITLNYLNKLKHKDNNYNLNEKIYDYIMNEIG